MELRLRETREHSWFRKVSMITQGRQQGVGKRQCLRGVTEFSFYT